ncbi:MAG: hypothetical protein WC382_12400 [Methanoregulaceae archaeon]
MNDDSGQISIDFLIGFTIFMVGFIFVVTLMSGLLIGLQSKTIDYDAVAYRTGVVLVEDSGEPSVSVYAQSVDPLKQWNLLEPAQKDDIIRLGLALSKDFPNILSRAKIDRFFDQTIFSYPDDYRGKLIFTGTGTYPYYFNITLNDTANNPLYPPIGDPYPDNHGYIKRAVFIKEPPNQAVFDIPGTPERVDVNLTFRDLYNPDRGPAYWIDPLNEEIKISILTDPGVILNNVFLSRYDAEGILTMIPGQANLHNTAPAPPYTIIFDDGSNTFINMTFPSGYFTPFADKSSRLVLSYSFSGVYLPPPVDYDYAIPDLESPLTPAILEVRVW